MSSVNNLVIVGSGPAAWTAAIYASRALLSPIVLSGEQGGGQLMFTTEVENFPGFELGIKGPDLMSIIRKQAQRFGTRVIEKEATAVIKKQKTKNNDQSTFLVSYGGVAQIETQSVIIATGAKANTLRLPGEDRLMGRGVGTCAVCDAPFYKDKKLVFVIGGGDSAVEEAIELSKFAQKVIVLVRSDALRASAIMKKYIKDIQNVEIWYKSEAKEYKGDQQLESVSITRDGKQEDIPADGLFYAIGHTPATEFLRNSGVQIDDKGYIKTYIDYGFGSLLPSSLNPIPSVLFPTSTSLFGIFAAGDCVDPRYRQAIIAAGAGCMAALDAEKWLLTNSSSSSTF